jgi:hypothetical protein
MGTVIGPPCGGRFVNWQETVMSDRQSLVETLRRTRTALLALRKSITASGHLDSMAEIDTLLAVVQTHTDKHIAVASQQSGLPTT